MKELEATSTPGAAIGIVQDGKLIYAAGVGKRNVETGDPVTRQTLFRLGSTTKMLTAAAVASLAAEGKVHLSETTGKYIPGLDPVIGALTVNQILSHTAGLKDDAVMNGRHDDAALGEEIRRWNSAWLFTKPGAIYSYSNPGFWLGGLVAESVTGKPYADAMEEVVFRPLGMTSTTLRPKVAMTRELSQPHDMVHKHISVLRPAPDNTANWPAGSVFSNVVDLSRFVIAMMNDGQIDGKQVLPREVVSALTSPHADIPGLTWKYGYGLTLIPTESGWVWSHQGSRDGYGSIITMFPSHRDAVIVLCNRTGQNLPKTFDLIVHQLGDPDPRTHESNEGAAISRSEFAEYTGTYRNGATTIKILERDGRLLFKGSIGTLQMTRDSEGWLLLKDDHGQLLGRAFGIAGPDGRMEYMHISGRASARVH